MSLSDQSDHVDLLQRHWPNALIKDEFLLEILEEIKIIALLQFGNM